MSRGAGAARVSGVAASAFVLALVAGVVRAQESAEAPAVGAVAPEALAIVTRAGDFLREAKRFSFSAQSGYEVVQEDGSRLEFGSARRYLVQRPDRVRVESEPRDGGRRLTLFDGKSLVHADLGENAYARADLKRPRDIDFMVDLVRDRLDMPLPLAELLRNDPRRALEDSLEAAFVVGTQRLRGGDCDQVALRNPDADVQLWIAQGDRPLLRRVVITYRTQDGQPSFWADLDDWSLTPEIDAASFRFEPPPGAERVRFEVHAARVPDEEGAP